MKLLRKIFKEVNSDIFNDMLDMPVFTTIYESDFYGGYTYGHCEIFKKKDKLERELFPNDILNINPVFAEDYNTIFRTIAHEMIHLWQKLNDKNVMKHGKMFKKVAREIEKFYKLPKGSLI